uniref:NADH-ubiquinone oxidoreductase chain 4 n=1 Tax=Taenia madoquae TaxID=432621 RepID=N0DLD3_9CEST|nr:NADH dehydrogenase subunit 4 [Taenia madoquae]BAN15621.1 NADH dehydrogenase subunit 4 [Taenia madoquae]
MFFFISVNSFLIFLMCIFVSLLFSCGVNCMSIFSMNVFNGIFMFDSISFYLIILVLLLGVYSQIMFYNILSGVVRMYLFFSLVFTVLSFCVNHCVVFWCVYELSMLPLLYLIFSESPYSERFLAGWYFCGYLLSTSLPLILILLYLSLINDSFFFSEWNFNSDVSLVVYYLLSFIFFTKVPLVPFHTWLPIVHAEAISIVSIFLSGYIMKLGLLGVYRCASFIFSEGFLWYLFLCCIISIFFLVTSCSELDGKRWLAFLSLAHIVVPFLGFYIGDWSNINFSFFYCLGHGLSAGIVFGLLWCFYDVSHTRNWILLKSSINGVGLMSIVVFSLLSLCSFPTTIQFFCEVGLVGESFGFLMYLLFWSFYLFFGGLVPLILCGHLLIRSECYESVSACYYSHFYFLIFLCLWCYFGILVL